MSRAAVWKVVSLGVLVALAACGDTVDDAPPPDADLTVDAAVSIDAPSDRADAAGAPDGSVTADASGPDAGSEPDATAPDASAGPDAMGLAGGEVCASAADVTAGGTYAGSTSGMVDDLSPPIGNGCPGGGAASGRDAVYYVHPTVQTSYKVTVVPEPSFDPMLYVVGACDFGDGCVASTVLNGVGVLESVTFTAEANQRLHIVVDGELGSSGRYTIDVSIQ